MPVHVLTNWENYEDPYILIGIHSSIEPYRLAYQINKYLNSSFCRHAVDQDVSTRTISANFPLYSFEDSSQNTKMFLVLNRTWGVSKTLTTSGLFANNGDNQIKTALIKEYSHIDYLLKIERDAQFYPLRDTLSRLAGIPHVISCYQLDQFKIKKQDYLTFE
ncbi:MAG: IPExxxVDY family protein [Nonlabens sp.]